MEKTAIIKAIEAEPEFGGDMPKELEVEILFAIERADMDFFIKMLRSAVSLTKRGIVGRVERLYKDELL